MTWVKLDDGYSRHPKIVTLTCERCVRCSFIDLLCYCATYLTDGRIEEAIIDPDHLEQLVDGGLVDAHEDGSFWVHDYLEYNPTRKKVESERAKKRAAGQAGGQAKALAAAKASASPSATEDARRAL